MPSYSNLYMFLLFSYLIYFYAFADLSIRGNATALLPLCGTPLLRLCLLYSLQQKPDDAMTYFQHNINKSIRYVDKIRFRPIKYKSS
jgi:hypothetical protein